MIFWKEDWKCNLFNKESEFLGYIIFGDGIRPSPNLVAKIQKWTIPQNVTGVRQFLESASYYRRFIRNFSSISKPLTELTCKAAQFIWKEKNQEAFEEIKAALTGPNTMATPQAQGSSV